MNWPLRWVPALLGAVLITMLVFLFMQSLIRSRQDMGEQLPVYQDVQVLRQQPDEPPPPQDEIEEMPEQPVIEPLAPSILSPTRPEPLTDLELPALQLDVAGIDVGATGKRWRAPMGAGGVEVVVGGQDARGFIEVVPFNTRRANVPEVAWQNKISGWVLVAFSVTPGGKTGDVRVLDANPRGVFEEKVIAAVEDWTYRVSFSSGATGDVVLTQKVEVLWENFPQNLPNVD